MDRCFLNLDSLTLAVKVTLSAPWEQGSHLSHGEIYFRDFKETKESQCVLLVPAAFQVTLIQNNQYAMVGYLGAVCPESQRMYQDKLVVIIFNIMHNYIITFSSNFCIPRHFILFRNYFQKN